MNLLPKSIYLSLVILSIFTQSIQAQKPVAARSFEIKIQQEQSSFQLDNKRMSTESGYPLAIYNPDFLLDEDTPENMGLQYLNANKTLLGINDSDIENLRLHAVRNGPSGTTVRFRQHLNELPVNQAEFTISINNSNKVSFLMNSFEYGVAIDDVTPVVSLETARQAALNKLSNPVSYSETHQELKIFHYQGISHLVHHLILVTEAPLGEWEVFVDAKTGDFLKFEDIALYCGHNHEHNHEAGQPGIPPPAPSIFMMIDGTGNVFDPDPLSSANADYGDTGFSDNNDNTSTQLDAEMVSKTLLDITFDGTNYSLVGPWAEIIDFESPNTGLFEQNSSTWDFNRDDDAFEAVNTYYHIDASMRYLNIDLGLNIRPSAYPGGVQFDPHGLNGSDNSHYIRSSDRVAFGEGGVDDAEDSDVIHHELGHGLHDWVTNGSLSQVDGLSEGSGDYWAASYNRHLGDWAETDDQYYWVFNWDGHNPFWGGRTVDYGATYPGGLTGSIHTNGQIWATCMMRIWNEIGRTQADKAFWEGLGDTNSSTSQNDAANAVYQAAIDMGYPNDQVVAMHTEMTNTGYTLPDAPLPVELTAFKAIKKEKTVHLSWITASENQNDFFTLERSEDGQQFKAIGIVDALGDSDFAQAYDFVDTDPLSVNYYRLKQQDKDGTVAFSEVISIDFDLATDIKIYPNPVSQTLFVQSALLTRPGTQVSIFDHAGSQISSLVIKTVNDQTRSLQISALPKGLYALKIEQNGTVWTERFFKQ